MVLNALKLNLDPANSTGESIVVQEIFQLVSRELVTTNVDINGYIITHRSIQDLQHPPNKARDFTLHDRNGAPNVLVISALNF